MASRAKMMIYNPTHVYDFECIIENFSKQRDIITGPIFHPITSCPEEWYLKLSEIYKHEHVIGKNASCLEVRFLRFGKIQFNLEYAVSLENIHSKEWHSITGKRSGNITSKHLEFLNFSFVISESQIFLKDINSIFDFPEDKLVVKGKFIFTAYNISTRIQEASLQAIKEVELKSSVKKDQKTMYRNSIACDVTFTLPTGELKAHKGILMSRSPVFASMFENDMIEKKINQVTIDDIDIHVMDIFLMSLYSGEIKDKSFDTVLALYYLADKYVVRSLQNLCVQILSSKMDEENACDVLILAHRHGDGQLKTSALKFIAEFYRKIATTDKWINFVKNYPDVASDVFMKIST